MTIGIVSQNCEAFSKMNSVLLKINSTTVRNVFLERSIDLFNETNVLKQIVRSNTYNN